MSGVEAQTARVVPINPPAAPFDYDGTQVDIDHVRDIVNRRAGRAVKVILDYKDSLDLTQEQGEELRRLVRREVFDVADIAAQFMESLANRVMAQMGHQVVLNELYQQRLDEIHAAIVIPREDEPGD